MSTNMKTAAFILTMLHSAVASAQQKPTTGYAPVNGLKMYYEVHGFGDPVVLLHRSFMTITNNWTGWIGELSKTRNVIALEMQGHGRTAETFKGSPIEAEYKKLSPTPDEFPNFVKRVVAMALKPYDFGADKLKAANAPMFYIHGDADGVRLEHISEMFRLKGDEIHGDLRPRSTSRLAVLANTTHVTLMERMPVIVPMVNDFFDAKPHRQ
ncbi:MAG: hypothetical protein L0Y72_27905 [Gemmataceae bacterium]|nr:hypothetical protein [Gemmataceae bacterium]MCI0742872.1 hypothetical protein [Gemmataceae bacterium]